MARQFESSRQKALQDLKTAFDKELRLVQNRRVDAQTRLEALSGLKGEREILEKAGYISFSVRMRKGTYALLEKVNEARASASKEYDRAD